MGSRAYILVQVEAEDKETVKVRLGSLRKAMHGMAESFGYESSVADIPFYDDEERTYYHALSSYPVLDREFERHRKVIQALKDRGAL